MIQSAFRLRLLVLLLCVFSGSEWMSAQIGGRGVYEFLNLTHSARSAGLGGKTIAIDDNDISLAQTAPSLLRSEMNSLLAVNYVNYFSQTGIGYGSAQYVRSIKQIPVFFGVQYIDYGKFDGYDAADNFTGTFQVAEYAFQVSAAYPVLDSLVHIGISLKPVYSVLETYHSLGLSGDLSLTYTGPDGLFASTLLMRNIGGQITTYYDDATRESLPFEVLLGISQKLRYAPFRFSITAHQLQQWDMTYQNPEEADLDPITQEPIAQSKTSKFGDNLLRHLIIGAEFLPHKTVSVRAGYNFQRRKELYVQDAPGTGGFSIGFGLNFKRFQISYGRSQYHKGDGTDHFSLVLNLSRL